MKKKDKINRGIIGNPVMAFVKFATLVLLVFLACGCGKDPKGLSLESDNFENLASVGLVEKKSYIFVYKESDCQSIINKRRKIIHLQKDNQSSYVNIKFASANPFIGEYDKGDVIEITLTYKKAGVVTENSLSMNMLVLKTDGYKVWLWSEENKMGLILEL